MKKQKGLQAIKEATVSFRNFNIGCVLFHVLSAIFMALFLGYLTPILIAVYFIQILFLAVNMVFYCIDDHKRMVWVHLRSTLIYLPFFIMLVLFTFDMYIFFQKLDDYHQKYALQQNVPDTQQKLQVALITVWLINFVIMPFFQGLSFCAYAKELGYYIDLFKKQLI